MRERIAMAFSNMVLRMLLCDYRHDIETRTLKRDRRLFCVLVLIRSQVIYISEADFSPNYELFLGAAGYPALGRLFFLVGSSFNDETAAFRLCSLMCLSSNTTRRPGLNRSLLLQTPSSTRRFRLRGKLLQGFHRDAILQCRLVRGMEENPTKFKRKLPKSAPSLCSC